MPITTFGTDETGEPRPIQSIMPNERVTEQPTAQETKPDQAAMVEEAERRLRSATSLEDLFAIYEAVSAGDVEYELLRALDQNRQGERRLYPPELKGVSW